MDWRLYWSILRRRWMLIAAVLVLDVVAAGLLYLRSARHVGYQACQTLYVADVSAPSLVAASASIDPTAQLLAGESAANFFADDVLDVAQSRMVADYIAARLHAPPATWEGAVSGARRDRTVDLCVANPSSSPALAAAQALGTAMTSQRARFVGARMARRTYVGIVSSPSAAPAPTSNQKENLALRLILGAIVAFGLALLWDALDPRVRDIRDAEQAAGVPVLATLA
ncbi:MAG: hypothetical protein JOZ41_00270 [Chloroflexi bacterium]|nr:hypothetical protein [Chloroflexota bacterium]